MYWRSATTGRIAGSRTKTTRFQPGWAAVSLNTPAIQANSPPVTSAMPMKNLLGLRALPSGR